MADDMTTEQRLARFFDVCIRSSWEGSNMEGGEIQDMAKDLGLIVAEPFNPEKHDDSEAPFPVEPGEDWFTIAKDVDAILTAAQSHDIPK